MKHITTVLIAIMILQTSAAQHVWKSNIGDYNIADNWEQGTVPGPNDDVVINEGVVIFPANGIYTANSITVIGEETTLDFRGDLSTSAEFNIYGDVAIDQDVTILYEPDSWARWNFVGSEVNHLVDVKNQDLRWLYLDTEDSQVELVTPITTSLRFEIKAGFLDTNGEDISTGSFIAGGGCNSTNCPSKNIDISGSTIHCSELWKATFNYGTLNLVGTHHIITPRFQGGSDIMYDAVTISDYEPSSSLLFDLNFSAVNNTFHTLTIDNQYRTKMGGSITVLDQFNVLQPNSDIFITREANGSTGRWSLNGEVNIAPDQGGCLDLTTFTAYEIISDTFSFHTIDSDLIFDYCLIKNIPTTGGGSFTSNNGYVSAYFGDWIQGASLPSRTLYWIGGDGIWNDGSNWSQTSGGSPDGCPPTIHDNVVFDEHSFSNSSEAVTLAFDQLQYCRNFTWTSMADDATIEDLSMGVIHPVLYISGSMDIDMPNIFDFEGGDLLFMNNDEVSIESNSVLPECTLDSPSAGFLINEDVTFKFIVLKAGYFSTEGFDMEVQTSFICDTYKTKELFFNGSTITVGNLANFGDLFDGNVTVYPGTSHIICNSFSSVENNFDVVEINNTAVNAQPLEIYVRKLILNGGGLHMTMSDLEVDSLVLNSNDSGVRIKHPRTVRINKNIVSNISSGNAPKIYGTSGNCYLEVPGHGNCLSEYIELAGMTAVSSGTINTPNAVDGGLNSGFDFSPTPSYTGTLYWTGGSGIFSEFNNWSTGSGKCPVSIDPSAANTLIFDENSNLTNQDTITVAANETVNALRFLNILTLTTLNLEGDLTVQDMVIDNSQVKQISPSEQLLDAERHIHVRSSGRYEVIQSHVSVGAIPTEMTETSLHIDGTSDFAIIDGSLTLRGHTTDLAQATLQFDAFADISVNTADLKTANPKAGQPKRDMLILSRNAYFKSLTLGMTAAPSQTVHLGQSLRCEEITVTADRGNLTLLTGVNLDVYN